ncbi:MAG: glycosyltransferase, partial [Maribacter sp.]
MQANVPLISIIIPVVNEADYIEEVLQTLQEGSSTDSIKEILVVDGGSTDGTMDKARPWGATVISSKKGRAAQMNYGAAYATGEVLFFLHGDTIPPKNFDAAIQGAFQNGS